MNNTPSTINAELQSLVDTVFTGREAAAKWLASPHELLDGSSPSEVACGSDAGAERVRDMLLAIKYGGVV